MSGRKASASFQTGRRWTQQGVVGREAAEFQQAPGAVAVSDDLQERGRAGDAQHAQQGEPGVPARQPVKLFANSEKTDNAGGAHGEDGHAPYSIMHEILEKPRAARWKYVVYGVVEQAFQRHVKRGVFKCQK